MITATEWGKCRQLFSNVALRLLKITQHHRFSMMHYGTKLGHFETSIIHFPSNEGVTEVRAARRVSKASRAEQASE